MVLDAERLPAWVTWQLRPFPDANLLLLRGRQPAMVDSGFVGHAQDTAAWARAHTGHLALVINTHWNDNGRSRTGATARVADAAARFGSVFFRSSSGTRRNGARRR